MVKWIRGIAAILSLTLFFLAAGVTFIFLSADNFLGRAVNFISKKIK